MTAEEEAYEPFKTAARADRTRRGQKKRTLELEEAERLYNQRREAAGPGHWKRFRRLTTLRAKDLRYHRPGSITLVKCWELLIPWSAPLLLRAKET